jgi:hypothetical protein
MPDTATQEASSLSFVRWFFVFLFLAMPTSFAALIVLKDFLLSGFEGNLGYGMFAVLFAAPVLLLQSLVYMRMWYLSATESSRAGLILAAFVLAFDGTLMLGFGMRASGC